MSDRYSRAVYNFNRMHIILVPNILETIKNYSQNWGPNIFIRMVTVDPRLYRLILTAFILSKIHRQLQNSARHLILRQLKIHR